MVGEWIRKVCVCTGAAILVVLPVNCRADAEGDAARALVSTDGLPVYAKASSESTAVAGLARGEAVQVKVELWGAGGDGPWCGIELAGENGIAGFVQCRHLQRESGLEQEWQLLGASSPQRAVEMTKVIIRGNQVLLPVVLRNGWKKEEILLLLDTGATRTVIHSEVASRLKINMGKAGKGLAQIADGSVVPTRYARIDDLTLGPHVLEDPELSIMDYNGPAADHDGLLGMDVLRGLRYRIDFEGQQIIWQ